MPNVTVVVGAFEDVDLPGESFDLVFSATAWHWIDPRVGYPKAVSLLAFGGALVLATNAHVAGGTQSEIAGQMAGRVGQTAPCRGGRGPPAGSPRRTRTDTQHLDGPAAPGRKGLRPDAGGPLPGRGRARWCAPC
ncbi:MAG: class I SAM-dependent methyltransferase [Acidimicrobiales bacterium]